MMVADTKAGADRTEPPVDGGKRTEDSGPVFEPVSLLERWQHQSERLSVHLLEL